VGPFIQELVLKGAARLYETDVFVAAVSSQSQSLTPPVNYVWVLYEIDLEPHDINLSVSLQGPNISGSSVVRSLGYPITGAYLATAEAGIDATVTNNTNSGGVATFRYAELTTANFERLVLGHPVQETAHWRRAMSQANQFPSTDIRRGG